MPVVDILEQNEATYKETIKRCLKLGFSAVSEAVVVSNLIVSGAVKRQRQLLVNAEGEMSRILVGLLTANSSD